MRSAVKQIAALALVAGLGFGLWRAFFPGADAVLARIGFGAEQVQAGEQAVAGQKAGSKPGAGPGAGIETGRGGAGRGARVGSVVVQPAGLAVLNERISALGTAAARSSVEVIPQSAGRLTQVLIGSGAKVAAGQVIAKMDAEAEQIAFDKAQLAYADARRTQARNAALIKSNAVAETQSQAVDLAASVAELNLRTAKQELDNRSIVAPIAGVVGILDITLGAQVTGQSVIARIEDASVLRVDFWLPERLSGVVAVGDTVELVAVARPQDLFEGKVAAVDTQIDASSGTYRVQATLENSAGVLAPGMALTVGMKFKGESFVSVNPLAILWGSDGAYVWRVVDGHAQKANVRIVQRNSEAVLVAGDIAQGDAVIVEGLDGLKAGAEVKIFGAPEPEAAAEDARGGAKVKGGDKPASASSNSAPSN